MSVKRASIGDRLTIAPDDLKALFEALTIGGYDIIGPTVRDGAVIYDKLSSFEQLPLGWADHQEAAQYRLEKSDKQTFFEFNLGPDSWKKFLFPPKRRLWSANRERLGFVIEQEKIESRKIAFFGVRPCELAAISILDKVFGAGEFQDPAYVDARRNTLIIAINCSRAGGTCFCDSMGSGPKAKSNFDLSLTEVIDGDRHFFVSETGSNKGADILSQLSLPESSKQETAACEAVSTRVAQEMGRRLDTVGVRELLQRNFDNPRWEEAARRCLTCGNCTMVCPTCFCSTVEDTTDLIGRHAERWQRWDSCFTIDFSYIHGGSIRSSARARYRQMVTHKLAAWVDQFGTMGCVGCGRCITWCPAAIDITEEVRVIREGERAQTAIVSTKESKYANA